MQPKILQKLLGHASIKPTMDRYVHVTDESMEDAVRCFEKKPALSSDLSKDMLVPAGEDPVCIIQEMGYQILYGNGEAVDPLTVGLCISEEEKSDPRVSMAIDEMLEAYVW